MTPAIVLLIVRVLLAVSLYAFLAAVLAILWRDLRSAGSGASVPAPAAYLLRLESTDEAGVAIPLAEISLIGRAADNTIRIEHVTVSQHHARIAFQSGQWILEDLGSRNGTWVNGIAVEGPMVITYGDDLQFGEVMVGLRPGHPPEARSSEGDSPAGQSVSGL